MVVTTFRLIARGSTPEGETWNTGLHVTNVGGTVDDALTAWIAAFTLFMNGASPPADSYKQLMKTTSSLLGLEADELSPFTGRNVTQAISTTTIAGTSTADEVPSQVCPVLSLRTALPTKAGRGRMYLPPITIDATLATGFLDSTAQSQASAAGQGMIQSLNGDGFTVVILHRSDLSTTPVTAVDVANIAGTQRRRTHQLARTRVRNSV